MSSNVTRNREVAQDQELNQHPSETPGIRKPTHAPEKKGWLGGRSRVETEVRRTQAAAKSARCPSSSDDIALKPFQAKPRGYEFGTAGDAEELLSNEDA